MNEDFLNDVIEEASKRYRQWCSVSIRGQMVMPQDGFEYWVALVTREKTLAEQEPLKAALRDCAEELAIEIDCHWQFRDKYPSQMSRYECDMEPVYTARKLLGDG